MSEEPTFSELLEQARAGDPEARDRLFAHLGRDEAGGQQMLAIARKILPQGDFARDLVESQDLVQSALKSGWLELSSFRGETPGEFMSWLRTILRHKLLRRTRKRSPRIGGAEAVEAPDLPSDDEDPSPEAGLVREETVERLRLAIEELPDDQRIVVERRLAGLTSREVAEELALEPATVRKRESRAMQKLRLTILEAQEGEEA